MYVVDMSIHYTNISIIIILGEYTSEESMLHSVTRVAVYLCDTLSYVTIWSRIYIVCSRVIINTSRILLFLTSVRVPSDRSLYFTCTRFVDKEYYLHCGPCRTPTYISTHVPTARKDYSLPN